MPLVEQLLRGELIGLHARVVSSRNSYNAGIEGRVVYETRNTLTIQHGGREKRIIKKNCVLEFEFKNRRVIIKGDWLVARPEERTKSRVKLVK
ncbi:hypothetical protein AUJ69_03550 [Candidatus Woesearchaeota archaeon CG1_02_47_18]|nr:MAG: hypothetical protein AUJ69_03550 [Candidatus Woesearchaeota archaeon CG1_02_47_18]HII29781.1 ribonuclease P protein subunit [Candidatus Woesearchaeota archaeon]